MKVNSYFAPAAGAGKISFALVAVRCGAACLALPFDAVRAQYAAAVRLGWVDRSLLASARVERLLASVEHLALGPLARRV